MRLLVCYDVGTVTDDGARRLRRVARACVDHGRRVQQSVFECELTAGQWEVFRQRLLDIIDPTADSLRVYRLPSGDERVEVYGVDRGLDFTGPLVV